MNELEKRIIDLYKKGYSKNEILSEVSGVITDENKCFDLITKLIEAERINLTQLEKDDIAKKRKERFERLKNVEKVEIADLVKEIVFNDNSTLTQKEKLVNAMKKVANSSRAQAINSNRDRYELVKDFTRETYPCFYDEYKNNAVIDEEYCISLAERIIANNTPKTHAMKLVGYDKMYKYLSLNNPELFERLNESFAKVDTKSFGHTLGDLGGATFSCANQNLLLDIIYEFRVPFCEVVEFLKFNPIFGINNIDEEAFLNMIKSKHQDKLAIEWYIAEMWPYRDETKYDDDVNYRINRFRNFVAKFKLLTNDFEKLSKFVKVETRDDLESVRKKIHNQTYKSLYNFDNSDKRKVIKFIYKYSLGEPDVQEILGVPRISKTRFVEGFAPENYDDIVLINGYNKLTEYKKDLSYAFRVGRK